MIFKQIFHAIFSGVIASLSTIAARSRRRTFGVAGVIPTGELRCGRGSAARSGLITLDELSRSAADTAAVGCAVG